MTYLPLNLQYLVGGDTRDVVLRKHFLWGECPRVRCLALHSLVVVE
jgi:hypothetical protein